MTGLTWWTNLGIRVKFAILIELAMIVLGAASRRQGRSPRSRAARASGRKARKPPT